jgi:hypothetical protein
MRVKPPKDSDPNLDRFEAAKIWFVEHDDEEGVIQMVGPQVGQLKKLRNLLDSHESHSQVRSVLTGKPVEHFLARPELAARKTHVKKGKKPPKAKDRKIKISRETTRYLIENMQLD